MLTPAEPTANSIAIQAGVVGLITISQGLFNHLGIRLTSRLTDFSGYVIFAGAVALTVALLAYAPSHDISRLRPSRVATCSSGSWTPSCRTG